MAKPVGTTGNAALSKADFAADVLRGLGITPTRGNVTALIVWMTAEGGHWHNDAHFNPLNTTEPEPGAGNTGTQGNIKVYRSWAQGVKGTVDTLNLPAYAGVRSALKGGSVQDVIDAVGRSPWGTNGSLLERVWAGMNGIPYSGQLNDLGTLDKVGNAVGDAASGVAHTFGSVAEAISAIFNLLTSPKTWLRVLYFVGGLVLGVFALKQLAAAGSNA